MPVTITAAAVKKVKEVMAAQKDPAPTAVRLGVRGGGCSGFSYAMELTDGDPKETDNEFDIDGLKVRVDQMSEMYLDGTEIDYIDSLDGAGFKFNNPNVNRTCGCGSSFNV